MTRAERLREMYDDLANISAPLGVPDPVPMALLELLDAVADLLDVPRLPPPDVLGPGDRLLFTVPDGTPEDEVGRLANLVVEALPGVPFVIVPESRQPQILRAGEAVPGEPA